MPAVEAEPFFNPPVHGYLHRAGADGLVLAHGAGSDANAPLLVSLAGALAAAGVSVLRIDLPFRQARPHGSPYPSVQAADREGLRSAVAALRQVLPGRVFLGGHSYGGRQATMVAAADPDLAERLLLLSYPLHPPQKPAALRTEHFPALRTPALFVHGARDPFGSLEELRAALTLIPAPTQLVEIERAGHDLRGAAPAAAAAFLSFLA